MIAAINEARARLLKSGASTAEAEAIIALLCPPPTPRNLPMAALKPCPCCESTNIIPPPKHWPDGCVYCRSCGLRANSPEAWNTRPNASRADDIERCAKIAEDYAKEANHGEKAFIREVGPNIATAIRALLTKDTING